jgi:UDP-glucuronate 4-epimerase
VVHGLDNLNAYYDVGLKRARLAQIDTHERFAFSHLDITDYDGLRALLADFRPDCLVHLAAQAGVRHSLDHPRAYVSANLDGFLGVLEACRAHPVRHPRLCVLELGLRRQQQGAVPRGRPGPGTPIAVRATKRANELMAQTYAHLYGIACSGVRFFTVYGPWGRPDMACYAFTKAILEGRTIDVFNHGRMQRDFTYIDDVTEALVRLVELPPRAGADGAASAAPHIIYNIGNHTPIELERFIAAIEAALGCKANKRYLPMQPGDVPATWADVERLSRATGFSPKTTIEDGVARFVSWYRTYHRTA